MLAAGLALIVVGLAGRERREPLGGSRRRGARSSSASSPRPAAPRPCSSGGDAGRAGLARRRLLGHRAHLGARHRRGPEPPRRSARRPDALRRCSSPRSSRPSPPPAGSTISRSSANGPTGRRNTPPRFSQHCQSCPRRRWRRALHRRAARHARACGRGWRAGTLRGPQHHPDDPLDRALRPADRAAHRAVRRVPGLRELGVRGIGFTPAIIALVALCAAADRPQHGGRARRRARRRCRGGARHGHDAAPDPHARLASRWRCRCSSPASASSPCRRSASPWSRR